MIIDKVVIKNFKGYSNNFTIALNSGLNIVVGDNDAGKSTILEAINLALTGLYNGRYLRNELSQYLFNESSVRSFIDSLGDGKCALPPPAYSGPFRSLILVLTDHHFWNLPITDSGFIRSLFLDFQNQ